MGALAVLIISLIPRQNLPEVGIINLDKAVHALMYGVLTFLFAKGFYKQPVYAFLNRYSLITAGIVCTLYGGFLEILQSTTFINRSGDWLDFLFDGIGALASMGILTANKNLLGR
ncbi:MAG: VanZ family protein [Gammaproteobacteria bacterium]